MVKYVITWYTCHKGVISFVILSILYFIDSLLLINSILLTRDISMESQQGTDNRVARDVVFCQHATTMFCSACYLISTQCL